MSIVHHLNETSKPLDMCVKASRFDAASVPNWLQAIDNQKLAPGQLVRFDLSEVSFIDSFGLSELVRMWHKVSDIGTVEVIAPQPAVKAILQLARLDKVMTIVEKIVDKEIPRTAHRPS